MVASSRGRSAAVRRLGAVFGVGLLLLAVFPHSARSLTFVPVRDARLLERSRAVFVGRLDGPAESACQSDFEHGVTQPYTRCRFLVENWIKAPGLPGPAPSRVAVVVPGGTDPRTGLTLTVRGAPALGSIGTRRAIVFGASPSNSAQRSAEAPDDSRRGRVGDPVPVFEVVEVALGFFTEESAARPATAGGDASASVVSASETQTSVAHCAATDGTSGRLRHFESFVSYLARHAETQTQTHSRAPAPASEDYWLTATIQATSANRRRFATYPDNVRWCEFDSGGSVTWFSYFGGQPGSANGAIPELQQALGVFTAERSIPIDARYGGVSNASGGLTTPDGSNVVLYEDPNNAIPGSYDCVNGGTLAIGGVWSTPSQTCTFRDFATDPTQVLEGDVVMQDGVSCGRPLSDFAELYTHELGHAHGLDHSVDTDATMYFQAHFDGRGAVLASDDIAGLQYLYCPTYPNCCVNETVNCTGRCGDIVTCGNATSCGACTDGNFTCELNQCVCAEPPVSACAGVQCGDVFNSCGGSRSCGQCGPDASCSGNICLCAPVTCLQGDCGNKTNACGRWADCGGCSDGNETCASNNTCVCDPVPQSYCANKACGSEENSCGSSLSCGSCAAGERCQTSPSGNTSTCFCPEVKCFFSDCEVKTNDCGNEADCGECPEESPDYGPFGFFFTNAKSQTGIDLDWIFIFAIFFGVVCVCGLCLGCIIKKKKAVDEEDEYYNYYGYGGTHDFEMKSKY